MKFENPIMNISMFEVENVVTGSSQGGETPAVADNAAAATAAAALNADKTLTITF